MTFHVSFLVLLLTVFMLDDVAVSHAGVMSVTRGLQYSWSVGIIFPTLLAGVVSLTFLRRRLTAVSSLLVLSWEALNFDKFLTVGAGLLPGLLMP